MKLNSFFLPVLASVATAADSATPQYAETYMLRHEQQSTSTSSSNPPSIPESLAEAILLQRLNPHSTLGALPESLDREDALSYVSSFGLPPRALFSEIPDKQPKQLVIAFSGVTSDNQYKQLTAAIPRVPLAFTAPGLNRLPARTSSSCAFGPATNPTDSKCWKGQTQFLHYDATKDSKIISQLSMNLPSLKAHALSGEMETTIVFLDPSTSERDELRRRQSKPSEKVMTEDEEEVSFAETTPKPTFVESTHDGFTPNQRVKLGTVPPCFSSKSACEDGTNSCSGHGGCVNKYPSSETSESACFFCQCKETRSHSKSGLPQTTNWGGSACQKRDISTPFWLFVGLTITLVATVAFSISLLFSVGEEKLPGVIGAGVSRTK